MGAHALLLELYNPAMGPGMTNSQLTAGGAIATNTANITMAATIPSWVVAGMPVYDVTVGAYLGVVSSGSGTTTLVLGSNAAHAGTGTSDVLQFGLTPSDLTVCAAAGTDIVGNLQLAQLKCQELTALLTYISTDLLTSSQDSPVYTTLASVITDLA